MPTLKTQLKQFFSESFEKSRSAMKLVPQNILLVATLVIMFALALIIRLSPDFNQISLLKEFDPWMNYHGASYMYQHGIWAFLHWTDYQSWWPEGNPVYIAYPGLLATAVVFAEILQGLGFPVTLYQVCFNFGPVMGACCCIATYYLGKEILDKKMGLLAGFFVALAPGYMQRTSAGFFTIESINVLQVVLVLYFFIRAVKKGSITNGVIAGVILGYLTISGGGSTYGLLLIPLFTVVLVAFKKYSTRLFLAYEITMGIALVIYSTFIRNPISSYFHDSDDLIPLAVMIGLPFVEYLYRKKEYDNAWYQGFWKFVKRAIPVILIGAGVFLYIDSSLFSNIAGGDPRLGSILDPFFRAAKAIVQSVGEQEPAPWSVFYYNEFIPILFIVPGVYFAYKRGTDADIILIIFTLTLYYTTESMTRIIVFFAPAGALLGAYGISQILKAFGAMFQAKAPVARRRKREARQMLDKSVGYVIFGFVGLLMVAQVYQAENIAVTQLPYTDIVVGGSMHDWEEALSWMQSNLSPSTVIVSWWDYGDWTTIGGNVTTVNDNETINVTRIALVGMAMSDTNEIDSARVFKLLGADYVLVYYGHLIDGIGGDEGKWPWMVKICDDYSSYFAQQPYAKSLDMANWYEPGKMTFNYNAYINQSDGNYMLPWFQSTIVRLMFHDEPTTTSAATNEFSYYTAQVISGTSSSSSSPKMMDYANGTQADWSTIMNEPWFNDLTCFTPAFISSNDTVKIYKVDYTALESNFQIVNQTGSPTNGYTQYKNGIANVYVNNTGSLPLNITSATMDGSKATAVPYDGTSTVQPGQVEGFWFNFAPGLTDPTWYRTTNQSIAVQASAAAYNNTSYNFTETAYSNTVLPAPNWSIHIDPYRSEGLPPDTVQLAVNNTGNESVGVNNIAIGATNVPITSQNCLNGTNVIPVGQERYFNITLSSGNRTYAVGDTLPVTVTTAEGVNDSMRVTFNSGLAKLSFLSDPIALPEAKLIDNNTFLKSYGLLSQSTNTSATLRSILPLNSQDSAAYTNGTIRVKVKNTGSVQLGLDEVRINGTTTADWAVTGESSPWLSPNDTATIVITAPGLASDAAQTVEVLGIDQAGQAVAADSAVLKTVTVGPAVKILMPNFYTYAFTNQTMRVQAKNVGTASLNLASLIVNSTTVPLNNNLVANFTNTQSPGSTILEPQQSAVLNVTVQLARNITATSYAQLEVTANNGGVTSPTVTILGTVNPMTRANLTIISAKASTNEVHIGFLNDGITGSLKYLNLTITEVTFTVGVNTTDVTTYQQVTKYLFTPSTTFTDLLDSTGSSYYLRWTGPRFEVGQTLNVTVYTTGGGEVSASYLVTS
jgi:dolichyl-diphosphooligosaccharide--protein glycosyltransferase